MTQAATATEPTTPALDRALPGWAVDAITDGAPTTDGRRIYGMCVRIAMSAYRRGWTESRYVNEIASPKSRLWAQVMTRRDGRTSSMPVAMKSLRKAWAAGVANANNVGMRTREEIADDAVELAYLWADRLDSGSDGLSATETAVMRFVVAETERRGMLRVTCPGRAIEAEVGVGYRTATRTLKALAARGLLDQYSAGRAGEPGKARAAIYGLVGQEPVSHINGGSTPMGHAVTDPCQSIDNTTPSAEVDETEPGGVSHINGGSTPMGHAVTDPCQSIDNTTPSAEVDETEPGGVSHRDMAADVSHRGMAEGTPRDTTVQANPWWRETFADVLRAEGFDPDGLTDHERAIVDRACAAGYDAETVAEALIARWEKAA